MGVKKDSVELAWEDADGNGVTPQIEDWNCEYPNTSTIKCTFRVQDPINNLKLTVSARDLAGTT